MRDSRVLAGDDPDFERDGDDLEHHLSVEVQAIAPDSLDDEQREAPEAFAEAGGSSAASAPSASSAPVTRSR